MARTQLRIAKESLEKANANLEPDLLTVEAARELLAEYAAAKKLASYGEAVLARRIDDCDAVARATGTSVGKAKQVAETGAITGRTRGRVGVCCGRGIARSGG